MYSHDGLNQYAMITIVHPYYISILTLDVFALQLYLPEKIKKWEWVWLGRSL